MEAKKGFLRLSCSVFAGFLGVTAGCLGLLDTLIYCALRVLPSSAMAAASAGIAWRKRRVDSCPPDTELG